MPMSMIYAVVVEVEWDEEARVWVATSDDVPGLTAEHSDFSALEDMVLELVPMLLKEKNYEIPVHIMAQANSRRRALVSA
jgi:hypothetical protein